MATHQVTLHPSEKRVEVPTGALLVEAIRQAGMAFQQPCGGQGRCGRCAVVIQGDGARRRSTIRLSSEDLAAGFALACQTVVEGDVELIIPKQEEVVRRLVTDRTARKVEIPFDYDPAAVQTIRAMQLDLSEPSIDDNLDDVARLQKALESAGFSHVRVPLPALRNVNQALRESKWKPWVLLETGDWTRPDGPARLIELSAERVRPVGLALDIGTTTVSAFLVDLESGEVLASAAEYNGQISCGEDVISRIVFAGKNSGLAELSTRVRDTTHELLERMRRRTGIDPASISKVSVVGNTTMIHLFLGLPPASIRLTPYIPTVNLPSPVLASEVGLNVHPLATVDCLPGVASYVGADITAGVLASGLVDQDALTLFIDIGTNGEMVLGTRDWMVTCACSAGPAFEGAGVVDGMRATTGAIEEVWVHTETFEPTIRVIGETKPRGICGSGLISLLAELFVTGVVDKGGNFKLDIGTNRVRNGEHGPEYVVAWGEETETGHDIALTKVDIDNLMRAKGAVYAGFSVLAAGVGVDLADVEQVLVGGAFGKYINVEKAVQIGLLPDLPWDRFRFLGNTAVLGAYATLLSQDARKRAEAVARSMTYVELSADNTFYEAFTAALFLPHTEISRFPNVAEIWERHALTNGNHKSETKETVEAAS
ncbi:MAG: ASKHA domain-containing protein [Anaerolineales bacterium]